MPLLPRGITAFTEVLKGLILTICSVTQSGALEGVTRVNVKSKNKKEEESTEPLLKQRENSHEYD